MTSSVVSSLLGSPDRGDISIVQVDTVLSLLYSSLSSHSKACDLELFEESLAALLSLSNTTYVEVSTTYRPFSNYTFTDTSTYLIICGLTPNYLLFTFLCMHVDPLTKSSFLFGNTTPKFVSGHFRYRVSEPSYQF